MESSLKSAASGIPNVYFRPFQNQTAMPGLLAAVDVMVLPSQGPGETWGLIVNEAQSVRCAVIVSDHVGCWPDLVAPRGNQQPGIVFPAGNQAALAEAMRKLVDDPTAIQRMGRDGLDRAKGYTYEAASKGLLEALDVVLKHGGKR
jgi:glycosyltransferase involved in cell wall biosynthesis